MKTENVSTLKVHKLTQAQYDREAANGTLEEYAIYITPDEEIDLSPYATKEYVTDNAIPTIFEAEANENGDVTFKNGRTASELFNLLESNMPVEVRYFLTSSSYIVLDGIRKYVLPIGSGTGYQLETIANYTNYMLLVFSESVSLLTTYLPDVFLNVDNTADYIIESGTSDDWTYRKWASGIAECWCRTHSIEKVEWDSMSVVCNRNLPFEFVGTFPVVNCSGGQFATDSSYVTMVTAGSTYVSAYIKCAHEINDEYACWFCFDVKGRWK